MRRAELYLLSLFIPLDLLFVLLGGSAAYFLRSSYEAVPISFIVPFVEYVRYLLTALPIVLVVYAAYGLYSTSVLRRRAIEEIARVALATTTVLMLATFLLFFTQVFSVSRLIILFTWILVVVLVSMERLAMRLVRWALYRSGLASRRVVLVGFGPQAEQLSGVMEDLPLLGYQLLGVVSIGRHRVYQSELSILGALNDLPDLLISRGIDELIITEPLSAPRMLEIIEAAHRSGTIVRYVPNLYEVATRNAEVASLGSVPLVTLRRTPLDGWGRIGKRLFDIVVSLFLIIVLGPLMLVIALLIRVYSRIPVLFNDLDDGRPLLRVGQYGQPFHYFKFRTMCPKTHQQRYTTLKHLNTRIGPILKIKDDPRITPLGELLRRTSLDELPELFLVLVGKMSLVGPRPHEPEEVARYKPFQRRVLDIKPGMTGLGQVSGRHALSFAQEVRLDSYYIENWSVLLDLAILLRTVGVILGRRGGE